MLSKCAAARRPISSAAGFTAEIGIGATLQNKLSSEPLITETSSGTFKPAATHAYTTSRALLVFQVRTAAGFGSDTNHFPSNSKSKVQSGSEDPICGISSYIAHSQPDPSTIRRKDC